MDRCLIFDKKNNNQIQKLIDQKYNSLGLVIESGCNCYNPESFVRMCALLAIVDPPLERVIREQEALLPFLCSLLSLAPFSGLKVHGLVVANGMPRLMAMYDNGVRDRPEAFSLVLHGKLYENVGNGAAELRSAIFMAAQASAVFRAWCEDVRKSRLLYAHGLFPLFSSLFPFACTLARELPERSPEQLAHVQYYLVSLLTIISCMVEDVPAALTQLNKTGAAIIDCCLEMLERRLFLEDYTLIVVLRSLFTLLEDNLGLLTDVQRARLEHLLTSLTVKGYTGLLAVCIRKALTDAPVEPSDIHFLLRLIDGELDNEPEYRRQVLVQIQSRREKDREVAHEAHKLDNGRVDGVSDLSSESLQSSQSSLPLLHGVDPIEYETTAHEKKLLQRTNRFLLDALETLANWIGEVDSDFEIEDGSLASLGRIIEQGIVLREDRDLDISQRAYGCIMNLFINDNIPKRAMAPFWCWNLTKILPALISNFDSFDQTKVLPALGNILKTILQASLSGHLSETLSFTITDATVMQKICQDHLSTDNVLSSYLSLPAIFGFRDVQWLNGTCIQLFAPSRSLETILAVAEVVEELHKHEELSQPLLAHLRTQRAAVQQSCYLKLSPQEGCDELDYIKDTIAQVLEH